MLVYYPDFLGDGPIVTSAHWDIDEWDQQLEATWIHEWGYGNPTHWMSLPAPPTD